jgi:hypothetical protein
MERAKPPPQVLCVPPLQCGHTCCTMDCDVRIWVPHRTLVVEARDLSITAPQAPGGEVVHRRCAILRGRLEEIQL